MNSKKFFITGLILAIILKLFVIDIVKVSGTSMENSIKDGQIICINKLAYGIVNPINAKLLIQWKKCALNDVVVYFYNGNKVVKRIRAVPHTPLFFSDIYGYNMKVNDYNVELTYEQYIRLCNIKSVPDNYLLMLGDNAADSIDSREYGFVSEKNIIGKVLCK
jgi:signal peptidase I